MPVTPDEQYDWQITAALVLADLVKRAKDERLPVLQWTVDYAGVGVTGHAVTGTAAERRAAVRAWCATLGITYAEREWPGGGAAIRCPSPDGYQTDRGLCRIALTADIQAGEDDGND